MKNINFNSIQITDKLFTNRIDVLSNTSIHTAIEKCFETPRIQNFIEANKAINGEKAIFDGIVYDDADIYKIVEGASYILYQKEDKELEKKVNQIIEIISKAQEESGYVTTKHTIHSEMKWVCLDAHEMYNMGHLIEACVAHYDYSNQTNFLNVGIKAADYLVEIFGENKQNWVPGHQEIELALLKLYRVTKNENYVKLCETLLSNRGKNYGWANLEYKDRAVFIPKQEVSWNKAYHQDSIELENISKVEGHAVRAMYMYTAMAEIGSHNSNLYIPSLEDVWENLVYKNMYITGGIGSTKINEGFTEDYDLPNDTAYCETCASIGMVFWNSKMYEITQDIKYLDVIERELKNGAISGLSMDGNKYFYDNPLSSNGEVQRSEWFETSCCPTQLMRFIPQIANYIYYESDDALTIAQPISSELRNNKYNIKLDVQDDTIQIINKNNVDISKCRVRIPLNMAAKSSVNYKVENGYILFNLKANKSMFIKLQNNIDIYECPIEVQANLDRKAFMYKGFVYCAEEVDNEEIIIFNDYSLEIENVEIDGLVVEKLILHSYDNRKLELVPYFIWNNRSQGKMRVWIRDEKKKMY